MLRKNRDRTGFLGKVCVYFILFFFISALAGISQNWLKKAEDVYEEGQVEKVPTMLDSDVNKKKAARDMQIQAMRLSVLSYIYDDMMGKADSNMLALLNFENEYKLLKEDSATEFAYLYQSYRTNPLLSFGINIGFNISNGAILEPYSTDVFDEKNYNGFYYAAIPGLNAGMHLNYYLDNYLKNLEISFEPTFRINAIAFRDEFYNFTLVRSKETQMWINVPVSLCYTFNQKNQIFFSNDQKNKIRPYIRMGFSSAYLWSSTIDVERVYIDDSHAPVKETDVDMNEIRKRFNYWVMAGAGLKYKVRMGFVFVDARYNFGFLNQVNTANRFNENLAFDNYYVDNDFTLSDFVFSIGYSRLLYRPKKKKLPEISWNEE